jgi:hypothetical protein
MPFLHPALFLLGQAPENFPKIFSQLPIQRLEPTLRYENNMVFALPLGVT